MLHAGLDLSRRRLDVCLLDEQGSTLEERTAPPDRDGLRSLVRTVASDHGDQQVLAVVESMNGPRFVHDTLELYGWSVELADAKAQGSRPVGLQNRSHRRQGPGRALPQRLRADDLAARPQRARSASWHAGDSTWSSTERR